ncbi:MAG: DUF3307 domain-containing protein [Aestuariivirga sp.]|jgi:Protein of unknown function (DUF3307)|nr:MAG: DUF3307 domain-containing protein [Hyphomicrobiales bacterium]
MPENAVHSVLLFVLLLQAKHFVCDGPLQTKDMVHDKGIYGQPLGLLHAGLHGTGTLVVSLAFGLDVRTAIALGAVDALIHYHIDFAKERLVRSQGWSFNNAQFWWAIVGDQFLHNVTYIAMAAYVFG